MPSSDVADGLSVEEFADERKRISRRFWTAFGFALSGGGILFCCLATTALCLPNAHRWHALRVELALPVTDGVALVGALLAVVVSINVALAAQQTPVEPVQRVRNADWRFQLAFIALLSASGMVAVTLLAWTCGIGRHGWGTCIGTTILALVGSAIAAAIQPQARSIEALIADAHLLSVRLGKVRAAIDAGTGASPRPLIFRAVAYAAPSALSGVLGCLSLVACFGALAPDRASLGELLFFSTVSGISAAGLLFAAGRWSLARSQDSIPSRIWYGWGLILGCLPAGSLLWATVLVPVPVRYRVGLLMYFLGTAMLPALLVVLESRLPGLRLMAGPRYSIDRALAAACAELETELAEVLKHQQAAANPPQAVSSGRTSAAASSP